MNGHIYKQTVELADRQTYGQTDTRMDGWIKEQTDININVHR